VLAWRRKETKEQRNASLAQRRALCGGVLTWKRKETKEQKSIAGAKTCAMWWYVDLEESTSSSVVSLVVY
jgi:hypothetical protein